MAEGRKSDLARENDIHQLFLQPCGNMFRILIFAFSLDNNAILSLLSAPK
jgi:hypothetical protein